MKHITSKLLVAMLGVTFLAGCTSSITPSSSSLTPTSTTTSTTSTTTSTTSTTSVTSSEDLKTPLSRGFDAEAVANPGHVYYGNDQATVTIVAAYFEDGDDESIIEFTVGTGAEADDMKIFYENPTAVAGTRYTAEFSLKAGVAFQGTVNGEVFNFIRGENNVVSHFEETANASITIVLATLESPLVSNTITIGTITFTEKVYTATEDIVIDGDLEDWETIRAYEHPLNLTGVTTDTDHKSVTFYAALGDDGLYLLAHVFHDVLINDHTPEWWLNTNFEFFVKGDHQYWVSANPTIVNENLTGIIVSSEYSGEANYESIAEVFVPNANLPEGAIVAGQIRVGYAWKTVGDQITGGEAAGGGYDEYWVPAGTWVNNADQTFVTAEGIFLEDQVNIEPTVLTIDGNLSDWAAMAAYTTNFAALVGTDATSHKDVTFYAAVLADGLYMAAIAHHDVSITDAGNWWENTNFEVFVNGGTQYYVSANGAVATGSGIIVTTAYEGTANFVSVAEIFIPAPYLPIADYQRVGFAWKTPGDDITGGAANEGLADSYWVIPMHWPNNAAEQYYVNADGIFATIA